ncbi:MAG: cupin domain-containing protein [bacterium]|nr:cupin domain-containing protein [bacterium]
MRHFTMILFAVVAYCGNSQTVIHTDSIPDNKIGSTVVKNLFNDSLISSFCIVIPKEVKAHKHQHHCEHVLVLEGEGLMKLGEKEFYIRKGDLVFIPQNSVHSVTSTGDRALKVLSFQAPFFDGSDRLYVPEK